MSGTYTDKSHAEGAAGTATVTLAASDNRAWSIHWIHCGSDTAVGLNQPQLAVTDGGTEIFVARMLTEAPWSFYFPGGLTGSLNSAVVATLSGCGGSSEVHVNVGYN